MVFYGAMFGWCDHSSPQDEWDEHTKELWIGWRKLHGPQRLGDSVRIRGEEVLTRPKKGGFFRCLEKRWLMMVSDG